MCVADLFPVHIGGMSLITEDNGAIWKEDTLWNHMSINGKTLPKAVRSLYEKFWIDHWNSNLE